MYQSRWISTIAFSTFLTLTSAHAQDTPTKPDNTRSNKDNGQTADQHKMTKAERDMAAQIRKSVVDDKALSTYAHNVKIIVADGTVTLRGPVRTEEEKEA